MTGFSAYEPVPATQPDRLAVVAHRHGLAPAPPATARTLEIACGDGANLVPLAFHRPEARFVGLEGSPEAARLARDAVRELGHENVEILEGPLGALEPLAGSFDYVIVHGVLSHVSDTVALETLAAMERALTPWGVAFLDAIPIAGRLLSQRLRELLRRQVTALGTVRERVRRMREVLAVLDGDGLDMQQPHTLHARIEVRFARTLSDAALVAEMLTPHQRAYGRRELARLLEARGLTYLSDAWDPSLSRRAEAQLRDRLEPLASDRHEAADLLELMTGPRRVAGVIARSGGSPGAMGGLLEHGSFAARLETRRDDVLFDPEIEVAFATRTGALVRTRDPLHKAVLVTLRAAWPEGVGFERLMAEATARLALELPEHPPPSPQQIERQARELLELHELDAVTFASRHPTRESALTDRPRASRLTRWQARRGHLLTDPQHRLVAVDELTRRLITRLDGERTIDELVGATRGDFERGELVHAPKAQGEQLGEPDPDKLVREALTGLAKAEVLVRSDLDESAAR